MRQLILCLVICSTITTFAQIDPSTNKIALDVSTAPENDLVFDYDASFEVGTELGMQQVGLFQNWSALEPTLGEFNFEVLDIADFYYAAAGIGLDLTLATIQTNNLEVPADLESYDFDDPIMIDRFKTFLDSVKVHLPNVILTSLIIGSEHDIYFGEDTEQWSDYTTFYNEVGAYAKTLWEDLNVASELTAHGIVDYNTQAQLLNASSDYIGISYYPLDEMTQVLPPTIVGDDFETFTTLYSDKPICFYQYGYPSSPLCGSSEEMQADFIRETFRSWDEYADHIRLIDFSWLHDLSTDDLVFYSDYYGIDDPAFLAFLETLGLRTWDGTGTDKLGLDVLRCQAKIRGYNIMDIDCTSGVVEEETIVQVYPNPASNQINLSGIPETVSKFQIVNIAGVIVMEGENQSKTVDISRLEAGIYFMRYPEKNVMHTARFVVEK